MLWRDKWDWRLGLVSVKVCCWKSMAIVFYVDPIPRSTEKTPTNIGPMTVSLSSLFQRLSCIALMWYLKNTQRQHTWMFCSLSRDERRRIHNKDFSNGFHMCRCRVSIDIGTINRSEYYQYLIDPVRRYRWEKKWNCIGTSSTHICGEELYYFFLTRSMCK